ncbi:G6PDH family F420-dependent oxidoreductase [Jatrophihabitans sp. GAS493]|uniref:TIGR03557 family F420-dependent LLM class oxidoreductase n=1 Tax=Jatrophihabitans sp. GAS493 TaxID=1907575 RepID=UPI000BB7B0D8|nr:TIGR03557 family F420-dependent LLM class oxidoreductase [Jatrophihabitans sp. GAS493]SOD73613.1 G6PDH family F420-dependent oxidoreductase [Jatrophihabitans sp. GAS493]
MLQIGYTLMCEQSAPAALVADAVRAEEVGFSFEVMSDHLFPWLESQGHSPAAWPLLGAVAQATSRVELMTYVTCPSFRYHPVVIAQQAATVSLLSGGRFTLGLGSGENLNEHVLAAGWPPFNLRHERFGEAVEIIQALLAGGYVNYAGKHFQVDSAKLWDLPVTPPPIAIAASGASSSELAGRLGDALIAVQPDKAICERFDAAGGGGKPRIGQLPVCYDADRDAAVARAHDQFRWFGGGWAINSELPGTAAFAAASQFVTPADVADAIPCGDDVSAVVAKAAEFADAGFTHLALIQIGGEYQDEFLGWAEKELLPALERL